MAQCLSRRGVLLHGVPARHPGQLVGRRVHADHNASGRNIAPVAPTIRNAASYPPATRTASNIPTPIATDCAQRALMAAAKEQDRRQITQGLPRPPTTTVIGWGGGSQDGAE